jgi:hypothetical protein
VFAMLREALPQREFDDVRAHCRAATPRSRRARDRAAA